MEIDPVITLLIIFVGMPAVAIACSVYYEKVIQKRKFNKRHKKGLMREMLRLSASLKKQRYSIKFINDECRAMLEEYNKL